MSGSILPSMEVAKQIAWDSVLTTGGVLVVAFAAVKIFGERFGIAMSKNGIIMLALAKFLGNLFVNFLQKNIWIKEDL